MLKSIVIVWVFVIAIASITISKGEVLGTGYSIPGTTQTYSGYDTETGTDAICWRSQGIASNVTIDGSIIISNPLVANFRCLEGKVNLLQSCPEGNTLTTYEPIEYNHERLRTRRWYNHTVILNLNLQNLNSTNPNLVSDQGSYLVVQVLLCKLGRSGFCSPFIHESSDIRLHAMNSTAPKPGPGDAHGGSHVHSKFQYINLDPSLGPIYHNIIVHVPMIINQPGQYFTIAAAQLYVGNLTHLVRYDMANAIHNVDRRVFTYQEPVEILVIPNEVRLVSCVAIGISGFIILYMLIQTFRYRNHQVMKLTQGYFLMLFLIAALVATVACMFLEPRNDLFCRISLPTILSSSQLLYAITLGRLWRINAVISPLLAQSYRHKSSWTQRCIDTLKRRFVTKASPDSTTSKKLRRKVDSKQLCFLIWLLAAPQIILQVLALILQTPYKDYEYNADESIGRAYCHRGGNDHHSHPLLTSIEVYGFVCFSILILILLIVAYNTKSLPSLFNETNDIFSTTLTTLVIFVVGGGIVVSTNSPTTSPALQYILALAVTLSITLNTSVC
jgi:hypothetical protein